MNGRFAFLGLLLALLMGESCSFSLNNQACFEMTSYGNCDEHILMWAYSRYDHQCISFAYSGCGGNTNRFRTREECQTSCRRIS